MNDLNSRAIVQVCFCTMMFHSTFPRSEWASTHAPPWHHRNRKLLVTISHANPCFCYFDFFLAAFGIKNYLCFQHCGNSRLHMLCGWGYASHVWYFSMRIAFNPFDDWLIKNIRPDHLQKYETITSRDRGGFFFFSLNIYASFNQ